MTGAQAAKAIHKRRMHVHQTAIRTMVDDARAQVLDARRRYMQADERNTRAMVEAQGVYLLALESYFDAAERAAGRR